MKFDLYDIVTIKVFDSEYFHYDGKIVEVNEANKEYKVRVRVDEDLVNYLWYKEDELR